MPDCGLLGATMTTSPNWEADFANETKPGANIPSSLVTKINFLVFIKFVSGLKIRRAFQAFHNLENSTLGVKINASGH